MVAGETSLCWSKPEPAVSGCVTAGLSPWQSDLLPTAMALCVPSSDGDSIVVSLLP